MNGSGKGSKARRSTQQKLKRESGERVAMVKGERVGKVEGERGKSLEKVDEGHYVLIDGRRWRATNPNLSEDERQRLVNELMKARRDVGKALREYDEEAELEARGRVNQAKVALGERGPKWWLKDAEQED